MSDTTRHLLTLSAQIVAAHTRHNPINAEGLSGLIRSVYNTLADIDPHPKSRPLEHQHEHSEQGQPDDNHSGHNHSHATNVYVHPTFGQTVFRDRLICMEDGLSMKMLKRHLLTVHGMTPTEYRSRWGLPSDYPMVAKDYAQLRSSLALQSGLGLKLEDRSAKSRRGRQ